MPRIGLLVLIAALASCAGTPPERPAEAVQPAEAAASTFGAPPVERPVPPAPPRDIMGRGLVPPESLAAFLANANPRLDPRRIEDLARLYVREAAAEGVNHDVAFAQMNLETGFLRFGGLVTPEMHNYCGLGSIGPEKPGERFPDAATGVRAHIQHLKGYATAESLRQELVDPRYRWIKYGTAPTIDQLAGTWAADKEYGVKLAAILRRLYAYSFTIQP